MSQETPSQIETQKDQVLPAKKEVKPLDEAAQKENADKRKIQEFASQIAEDPKIFLEKIQKDPKFASENKQLIVQAVMQIHKLIFEDRDQITNRLWNDGITGK